MRGVLLIAVIGCSPRFDGQPPPTTGTETTPDTTPFWPGRDTGVAPARDLDVREVAVATVHGSEESQMLGGAVHAGDLTGDGEVDLLAYSGSRFYDNMRLFAGPFVGDVPSTDAMAVLPHGKMGSGLGDLDGDGALDIAVLRGPLLEPYEFQLYFGPWTERGSRPPDALVRLDDKGDLGQVCDANGDGVSDLAIGDVSFSLRFVLGPLPRTNLGDAAVSTAFWGEMELAEPSPSDEFLCGSDVTGDGAPDLLVQTDPPEYHVWLVDDPGWGHWHDLADVAVETTISNGGGALSLVGDLTGDGHADLYNEFGTVGELYEVPVSPMSEPSITFDWGDEDTHVLEDADLDVDGSHDLVIGVANHGDAHGAVFLLYGPLTTGVYRAEDADLRLYGEEDSAAQLGQALFSAGSDLWGVNAGRADGIYEDEGHIYLFSGVPLP